MITNEIQPNEWNNFFNSFSRDHYGWNAKVEIFSAEIGAQVEAENLPLNGIAFENVNGVNKIEIMVGEKPTHHVSHTIANPSRVMLQRINETEEVLELENDYGVKTLLIFHSA